MKKRCTNSACRRVFSLSRAEASRQCPYCGKLYPRLPAPRLYRVLVTGLPKHRRTIRGIVLYRQTVGMQDPKQVRLLLERCGETPVEAGAFPIDQARVVLRDWRALGFRARLV